MSVDDDDEDLKDIDSLLSVSEKQSVHCASAEADVTSL